MNDNIHAYNIASHSFFWLVPSHIQNIAKKNRDVSHHYQIVARVTIIATLYY